MVNRQRRDWSHERIHVRFYTSTQIRTEIEWALEQRNVASGSIWVSNPSLTALDLVNRPKNVGGLNNVATVLAELDLPALEERPTLHGGSGSTLLSNPMCDQA